MQKSIDAFIKSAYSGFLIGDGPSSIKAQDWLKHKIGSKEVLLTGSCTQALEFGTLLGDFKPGDEVVLPSFTFTSAGTALANFDLVPVFVDVMPDDLNISCRAIEKSITPRTRAISVLNYNGVAADWDWLRHFACEKKLYLIEDNAHGLGVTSQFGNLGSLGDVSTLSFHATKNIHCGEGGALVLNDEKLIERSRMVREKGTNRHEFLKGSLEKYEWIDKGGSYLLPDLLSAFLMGQFDDFEFVQNRRRFIWKFYFQNLHDPFTAKGWRFAKLPHIESEMSGHIFYMIAPTQENRNGLLDHLANNGIQSTFHYQPLHKSPAGIKFGRSSGSFTETDVASSCLLRLPIYPDLNDSEIEYIVEVLLRFLDIKKS
jgi:dTDP-4-amino-4,6-dideoxygalactose transaminase